ncbi:hypothetical protein PENSPDRAFT_154688 [Peniophora sp. CONT]|nr:hypothetical protein PENSPDRAFT_154688 [Peniophora sp. CONT]
MKESRAGQGIGSAFPPTMLENLHSRLSDMWYPAVQTIREAERKARLSGVPAVAVKRIVQYRDAWLQLGKACNIDEIQYGRQMDAMIARCCSWRDCKYFNAPSDDPMRVCKGCKEARYCSRECQVA